MQKENNNTSFETLTSTTTTTTMSSSTAPPAPPPLFSPTNPFASPTYLTSTTSFYSSLFQSNSSSSPSTSFSDTASFDGGDAPIHDVLEYQQLYNRYTFCLAQLGDAIDEVDALSRENDALRLSNADLSRRVALLFSRDQLLSEFNRLSVAAAPPPVPVPPQPLAEYNRIEQRKGGTERVALPKSISVRSKGYLKMMSRAGQEANRQMTASQAGPPLQRVYVPGPKTEEDQALELDVYNQGMFKTELCNKWQETGACPYGENCQFAHGIKELRPVIRHPRYKTEVCRMVLAGDICPYGHRCHFRHSLTEQERLMVAQSTIPPH